MKRPNPAHVSAIRDFIARSPFPTLLSMRPTELAVGRATLEIEIAEKHRQLLGVVHGGVIASLIDTATFWSVYYAIDDPDAWLTTVDLKLNFLAPARQGRLIARGRQKRSAEPSATPPLRSPTTPIPSSPTAPPPSWS